MHLITPKVVSLEIKLSKLLIRQNKIINVDKESGIQNHTG